jgi:hypothetical protein
MVVIFSSMVDNVKFAGERRKIKNKNLIDRERILKL